MIGKRVQRRGVISSMSLRMRLVVAALSALTFAFTLVFAGLLYRVGTAPNPAGIPAPVLIAQTAPDDVIGETSETAVEGAELIAEDEVPLAAPDAPRQPRRNVPIHLILGFAIGFAVVFFVSHIMRVNANISDMNRKTQ